MTVLLKIKSFLAHGTTKGLNIDDPETSVLNMEIIRSKPFLRQLYQKWYLMISESLPDNISGPVLELGSGGGFLNEIIPDLIASDLFPVPKLDIIIDGRDFPFSESCFRSIVMVDVLHHIPDTPSFFRNASRCLKTGGALIMIEPWTTCWSKLIYNYLHHEPFDIHTKKWNFPEGGPLSQANSALPWIIFKRDRKKFIRTFNQLHIKKIQLHTPFSYLLSGGVSFRSFIPGSFFEICSMAETALNPLMKYIAMFAIIVVTKSPLQK